MKNSNACYFKILCEIPREWTTSRFSRLIHIHAKDKPFKIRHLPGCI